jgi:hypothetical protein
MPKREAISELRVYVGSERLTVDAWSLDKVSVQGDEGLAYCVDDEIHMNPARILTHPHDVADRLAVLRSHWLPFNIVTAIESARAQICSVFLVKNDDTGGVSIELCGKHLRIERVTWNDRAEQLAEEEGLDIDAVQRTILYRGLASLATAVCMADW